ncbi:MAG: adenylate/guanylate cyclase domain-containing protein [Gallionellaceae bacterium]|jgi:hypothetical protein
MEERGNKTIICSVFFLDIVEYSKKSVAGQISLKERFNAFLSAAIRDVPVNDRIILDTGDGAAISFLGDVEDALRAALGMRSSLLGEEELIDPPLLVRMGINLGPVRLVRDINGQPNIVGDGINVAQRVMGFADPGQILVSRSYYDAASRLSAEYAGMFHYGGSRTDKHVREHEVYAIGYPGDLASAHQSTLQRINKQLALTGKNVTGKFKTQWNILLALQSGVYSHTKEALTHAPVKQKVLYVGLLVIPFLLLWALLTSKTERQIKTLPSVAVLDQASSAVMPTSGVAPATVGLPPHKTKQVAAGGGGKDVQHKTGVKDAQHMTKKVELPKQAQKTLGKESKETKPGAEKNVAERSVAERSVAERSVAERSEKTPVVEDIEPGQVSLSIKPWGEVYVDGKMSGVSPPLTRLKVSPGSHVIEIRNSTFPVYRQSINVRAGELASVSHKFAN